MLLLSSFDLMLLSELRSNTTALRLQYSEAVIPPNTTEEIHITSPHLGGTIITLSNDEKPMFLSI